MAVQGWKSAGSILQIAQRKRAVPEWLNKPFFVLVIRAENGLVYRVWLDFPQNSSGQVFEVS